LARIQHVQRGQGQHHGGPQLRGGLRGCWPAGAHMQQGQPAGEWAGGQENRRSLRACASGPLDSNIVLVGGQAVRCPLPPVARHRPPEVTLAARPSAPASPIQPPPPPVVVSQQPGGLLHQLRGQGRPGGGSIRSWGHHEGCGGAGSASREVAQAD
jgi:hypothetical protein